MMAMMMMMMMIIIIIIIINISQTSKSVTTTLHTRIAEAQNPDIPQMAVWVRYCNSARTTSRYILVCNILFSRFTACRKPKTELSSPIEYIKMFALTRRNVLQTYPNLKPQTPVSTPYLLFAQPSASCQLQADTRLESLVNRELV